MSISYVGEHGHHPWFQEDKSFVTRMYRCDDHQESIAGAAKMERDGWSPWLVGDNGFVMFMKRAETQSEKTTDDYVEMGDRAKDYLMNVLLPIPDRGYLTELIAAYNVLRKEYWPCGMADCSPKHPCWECNERMCQG